MSRIDDLIKEHCPDGVEYKELGKVCDFQNGFAFKRKFFRNEGLPIIRIANIQGNKLTENRFVYFDESDYSENLSQYKVIKDNILVAMSGATTGKIGYVEADKTFYLNQRVGKFIPRLNVLNNRFLFHYLLSKENELLLMSGVGSQPNLSSTKLMKLSIPSPPLPVQQEIVTILDKFTKLEAKLEAELEAELEARQRQYAYYRDSLLSFDEIGGIVEREIVRWRALGEVGMFVRGSGLQKKDFTESGVGCIHYGQIYTHYGTYADQTKSFTSESLAKKLRKAKKGDLVIATTGENDEELCKAVAWLGDEEVAVSGHAYIYQHSLNPKYVAYFFMTDEFQKQKRPYITGTKVRDVSGDSMSKIKIPVPPLEEQARIVTILDKFDALANDISSGLPAEITARRKQYEYYRNRLLTFREAA